MLERGWFGIFRKGLDLFNEGERIYMRLDRDFFF